MSLQKRPWDCALVACFALFAFTSLVMEPYFVFAIDYARAGDPFAAGWQFYARFDPAFADRPLFLRVLCGVDLFVFGPFYLLLIGAFIRADKRIRLPVFIWSGAIVYSTVIYFAWEIWSERARANIPLVILINIPYSIVPILTAYRLRSPEPFRSEHGNAYAAALRSPQSSADARVPQPGHAREAG